MPDKPDSSDPGKASKPEAGARTIHRNVTLALQFIMLVGLALSVYEGQWLNVAAISGILLLTI